MRDGKAAAAQTGKNHADDAADAGPLKHLAAVAAMCQQVEGGLQCVAPASK
jgi:hypothetical protein